MSSQKKKTAKTPKSKGAGAATNKEKPPAKLAYKQEDGLRETFDSIVFAFVLAFLFRSFAAEAFIIPTGSMAPTLMGRNKDVVCPKCNFEFPIGASEELTQSTGKVNDRIRYATCINCRYDVDVFDANVFNGDRILVTKFSYEFRDPQRFDVIVFKYPESPGTSYIKRLIGLPGESVKIEQGDVYTRTNEEDDWQIARKADPNKQQIIQLSVYNNNFPETKLHAKGWPLRWASMQQVPSREELDGWRPVTTGWSPINEGKAFELKGADSTKTQWLRYQNIVPTHQEWDDLESGRALVENPVPELILDFCSYNTTSLESRGEGPVRDPSRFWVGDLTLGFQADLQKSGPESDLTIELNEGVRQYRCRFNLTDGQVQVFMIDHTFAEREEQLLGTAQSSVLAGDSYHLRFANVDNRLCLWVDESLVEFDTPLTYESPAFPGPQERDRIPVGIAARGVDLTVSDLILQRDIYYQAVCSPGHRNLPADKTIRGMGELDVTNMYAGQGSSGPLYRNRKDPEAWWKVYIRNKDYFLEFEKLADDEFFVMGDNSPRSKDSRLWENERGAERRHAVKESLLVGKAFYIFWPHGVPFGNGGQGFSVRDHKNNLNESIDYPAYTFPFYPQINKMRRIR